MDLLIAADVYLHSGQQRNGQGSAPHREKHQIYLLLKGKRINWMGSFLPFVIWKQWNICIQLSEHLQPCLEQRVMKWWCDDINSLSWGSAAGHPDTNSWNAIQIWNASVLKPPLFHVKGRIVSDSPNSIPLYPALCYIYLFVFIFLESLGPTPISFALLCTSQLAGRRASRRATLMLWA